MGMIRDLRSGEALGEMDYASSVLPTEHPAISLNEVKLGHAAQKDNPQGTPIRSHLAHGAVLETWSRPAACPLLRNERRRADWNRPPPGTHGWMRIGRIPCVIASVLAALMNARWRFSAGTFLIRSSTLVLISGCSSTHATIS